MDEEEISARIDARGRAAATGTHRALEAEPIPSFDPDAVVVPLGGDRGRSRRWLARGAVAAVVLVLVGVAGLVTLQDRDGSPVVDAGPARRFVADHLPEGLVPSFLTTTASSSEEARAELYGPAPLDVRAVVSLLPDQVGSGIDFEPEGRPDWEEARFGHRDGYVMSDVDLGWYGLLVVVDGTEVSILGDEADRDALEGMAATVEVADGEVVADSPSLPGGWSGQGRVSDMFSVLSPSRYGGGVGSVVGYMAPDPATGDIGRSVTVTTGPGGVPEVAATGAFPLPNRDREPVTVRGHDGLLVGMSGWTSDLGGDIEAWVVAWVERPGEVIRVSGSGVSRDEVLAVAEGVRPAEQDEWRDLERQSLRSFPYATADEVVLGEGTFTTGEPWLLVVETVDFDEMGITQVPPYSGETDETESVEVTPVEGDEETGEGASHGGDEGTGEGSSTTAVVGGPIPSDGARQQRLRLRTNATTSTGVSSSSMAGPPGDVGEVAFPDGITVETGDRWGWTYGLLGARVATVELVDAEGTIVARAEVLAAGGHRGFFLELTPDLMDLVELPGGPPDGPGTFDQDPATVTPSGPTATTVVADGMSAPPGPELVARDAQGNELGRQRLP